MHSEYGRVYSPDDCYQGASLGRLACTISLKGRSLIPYLHAASKGSDQFSNKYFPSFNLLHSWLLVLPPLAVRRGAQLDETYDGEGIRHWGTFALPS